MAGPGKRPISDNMSSSSKKQKVCSLAIRLKKSVPPFRWAHGLSLFIGQVV